MNIKEYISNILDKIFLSIKLKNKYDYKINNNLFYSDYQINGIINISKKEKINLSYLLNKIKKKIKKIFFNKKYKYNKSRFY